MTLSILAALNRPHEIALHVSGALNNGLSPEEIEEVFRQCESPLLTYAIKMVRMEAVAQARACIEQLDDRSQQLVRLRFEDGLSYKQMSERPSRIDDRENGLYGGTTGW